MSTSGGQPAPGEPTGQTEPEGDDPVTDPVSDPRTDDSSQPGDLGTQDDLSDHAPVDDVQQPGAVPTGPGHGDDPTDDESYGQRTQG